MAAILITGSTDGLGRLTAESLLSAGHRIIVHARTTARLRAVDDLLDRGATGLVGDLAVDREVRDLSARVNDLGPLQAVIHNAGVLGGPSLFDVNVRAPYVLTGLIRRPHRLIYLSSGMHRGGRVGLEPIAKTDRAPAVTYSDSKLLVTMICAAVARLWPDVLANAVDPGWVPTRMGGPGAPDDLRLGCVTQEWLATSNEAEALTSGGYWHHQQRRRPHASVSNVPLQDALLDALERDTGVSLRSVAPTSASEVR